MVGGKAGGCILERTDRKRVTILCELRLYISNKSGWSIERLRDNNGNMVPLFINNRVCTGRGKGRNKEKDGEKRYATKVIADSVSFLSSKTKEEPAR